jgi:hypothetical protein
MTCSFRWETIDSTSAATTIKVRAWTGEGDARKGVTLEVSVPEVQTEAGWAAALDAAVKAALATPMGGAVTTLNEVK